MGRGIRITGKGIHSDQGKGASRTLKRDRQRVVRTDQQEGVREGRRGESVRIQRSSERNNNHAVKRGRERLKKNQPTTTYSTFSREIGVTRKEEGWKPRRGSKKDQSLKGTEPKKMGTGWNPYWSEKGAEKREETHETRGGRPVSAPRAREGDRV